MRILTSKEIKDVEELAFEKYFSQNDLMFKAGEMCASKIIKRYGELLKNKTIAVFCGNGKNAGDGFVIAKLLCDNNFDATIVLADKEPTLDEPKEFFNIAMSSNVKCVKFNELDFKPDFVVDCIFGIGFHGEVKPPFDKVFDAVNNYGATVIAIDTPSGTNATDGSAINAIKADFTIAISTLKYCHVLPPSNAYCGKTVVGNIGIPEDCYKENYANTITKQMVKSNFTKRDKNSNKGTFGHQLNICGSYFCSGAGVICANGALKTGVGLLKCLFPKSLYNTMTTHLIQPIFKPVTENEDKTLSMGALTDILDELNWANSVVLGCGIGVNDDTEVIVNQILKESEKPIVLDADGINCLLSCIDILKDKKTDVIITPHPQEMARLLNKTVDVVQSNRIKFAKDFSKEYGVITVLKGANTIVTNGSEVFVNTTGNPGMAMGGTGDLLSGIIGSFLAQGMSPLNSAISGVYVHSLCGDACAKELSERGMTVDDMIYILGALMSEFE